MIAWGWLLTVIAAVSAGACSDRGANTASLPHRQEQSQAATERPMRIRIITEDGTFTAILEDNETARDFASLLPAELTLNDYNRTEKVADLPRRLTIAGAPEGADPEVGDIAYFAPWGNLAIYYRDFAYSPGLVRLGRLDGGAEALAGMGAATARVEIIPEN